MHEEPILTNDLNKVFIPCKTALEMEILTSLFLGTSNYEKIREVPGMIPTSDDLIQIFNINGNIPQERIIDYFINVTLPKLKPIVMYERNHHDRVRMGNVSPYSKTRKCLFFALHQLKTKFLIIKNFMTLFRNYDGDSEDFFKLFLISTEDHPDFLAALKSYYTTEKKKNLQIMLPKKHKSERIKKLIDDTNAITNEKLIEMATYEFYEEDKNVVKLIMREIKASLFVCKLMLAKIDIKNPFIRGRDLDINEEEFMISNDFLPTLLPNISICTNEKNYLQLKDLLVAFEFMMNKVLDGINYAYEISSGKEIILDLGETLYSTGL